MAFEDDPQKDPVLDWYSQVSAKYLDLVGDYAGKERFFVEGDSLLLECFQDEKLDFDPGFQLLHAIYLVEDFFQNLRKRGCVFDVVFFDDHQQNCVPADSRPARYLLARKVIVSHLLQHAKKSISVYKFRNTKDTAFRDYLHDSAIYFALCSDGSRMAEVGLHELRKRGRAESSEKESAEGISLKRRLRHTIGMFMQCNLDVAITNGLTWQDSKVFAFVLERAAKTQFSKLITPEDVKQTRELRDPREDAQDMEQTDDFSISLPKHLSSIGLPVTFRTLLLSMAAQKLIEQKVESVMLFALLLHTVLLEVLPLSSYPVTAVEFDGATETGWADFVDDLSVACMEKWEDFDNRVDLSVVNLLDGRLIRLLLGNVPSAFDLLPDHLQHTVRALSEIITGTKNSSYKPIQSRFLCTEKQTKPTSTVHTILSFRHPAFDAHLRGIHITVEERAQHSRGKISQELTHWHNSGKALVGARPQLSRTPKEEQRMLRSLQRFHAEMTAYAASLTNSKGKFLEPELILVERHPAASMKVNATRKGPPQQKQKPKQVAQTAKSKPVQPKEVAETNGHGTKTPGLLPPELDGKISSIVDKSERLNARLLHTGPYLDRSLHSRKDIRVKFDPDAWQVRVLDEVDQGNSLLVVAPTSAGKTFISFYAMEKVLRANDEDVIVYVAPTKALVNQIAAEVQARFKKNYRYAGHSVVAIHTRDYRVNNPIKSQILVTVPHILQIMLMSPSNRNWVPNIKTIIFDEVHSFGLSEDGVVWEQLLMMAPCRIIALSATIGNADSFASWLSSTQSAGGRELTHISHNQRHSDLRKYLFRAPGDFTFAGLPKLGGTSTLGLEGSESFRYVNPVACLSQSGYVMPPDLALEGRDSYLLWEALQQSDSAGRQTWHELSPNNQLDDAMIKADVVAWGEQLKTSLTKSFENSNSRSKEVVDGIANELLSDPFEHQITGTSESLLTSTLPLLCKLREQDALPAILFNYNRGACEDIACHLLKQLETSEEEYKSTSTNWAAKVEKYEMSKKKSSKETKKKPAEKLSKSERAREDAGKFDEISTFDPDQILDEYSFANMKNSDPEAMRETIRTLEWQEIPETLIKAFKRGIGVHHSGMNRRYRQAVEVYFRKGYLTVVVATGTLSLGINMPCKTVVFSGESVFLTALNFRQSAGRAGRRGFDLLGNVVFQNIPAEKALRLLSSRLPDLNGHFPLTTSFVLRLLKLLHGTDNAGYAMQMVNSLLSQPRLYLGGDDFKEQVLHHVRFSIEYLRSQGLIDANGVPVDFASIASRLYFVENSAFAFHALLREGFFHDLAEAFIKSPDTTLRELMLVMAQLFGRREMRAADLESSTKHSASIIKLPDLTSAAAKILSDHNNQTLDTYTTYVSTFVEQHCKEPDNVLPFSGVKIEPTIPHTLQNPLPGTLPPVHLRSAFVALSGHVDTFESISDLCSGVRAGVFLEKAVIPHLDMGRERATPLNAYLYDFYMHGSVKVLVEANRIPRGDVWFVLKDFSLVLATIVTSFENFLQGKDDVGLDDEIELELNPVNDSVDGLTDDMASLDTSDTQSKSRGSEISSATSVSKTSVRKVVKPKKKVVLDSWDDEDSESDNEPEEDENEEVNDGDDEQATRAEERLFRVYTMFKALRQEFDIKFKKMWA